MTPPTTTASALRKVKQVYVDRNNAIIFQLEDGTFLGECQHPTGNCWAFSMGKMEYSTIHSSAKKEISTLDTLKV